MIKTRPAWPQKAHRASEEDHLSLLRLLHSGTGAGLIARSCPVYELQLLLRHLQFKVVKAGAEAGARG